MNESTIKEIFRFLEADSSKLGVIGTANADTPQVAFVYYSVDEKLNIYFVTRSASEKYKNLMQNPKIAFAVASENPSGTVQIQGKAEIVTDPDLQRTLFPKLIELATRRNAIPPLNQYSDTSEITFMKITPAWARFSDFEVEDKTQIFHEVKFQ